MVSDDRSDVSQRGVPTHQCLLGVRHLGQRQSVLLGQLLVHFENLGARSASFVRSLVACDVRPQIVVDLQKPTAIRQKCSVAVLGKNIGGLAPHHLGGNNG